MTNNCRTECADCEHDETCLLEDYPCSMLEESDHEKFNNFVFEVVTGAGFILTEELENKCFVAENSYGVKISRTEEDATVGYKVELNLDPCSEVLWSPGCIKDGLVTGYEIIEEISNFEGTLVC